MLVTTPPLPEGELELGRAAASSEHEVLHGEVGGVEVVGREVSTDDRGMTDIAEVNSEVAVVDMVEVRGETATEGL